MKVKALKPFTMRNSSTGELTSVACGSVITVTDAEGGQLITDGLAEAYTLVNPTGTITITENGEGIDVSGYADADVNVSGGGGSLLLFGAHSELLDNTEERKEADYTRLYPFEDGMTWAEYIASPLNPLVFEDYAEDHIFYETEAFVYKMVIYRDQEMGTRYAYPIQLVDDSTGSFVRTTDLVREKSDDESFNYTAEYINDGGGDCIVRGAKVLTPNKAINIEDVKVGESLTIIDPETTEVTTAKVLDNRNLAYDEKRRSCTHYFKYTFDDGTIIKLTGKHRFFNVETQHFEWLPEWNIGDRAYKSDGTTPRLVSVERIDEPCVYECFWMEDNLNYFVDGLLSGNRRHIKVGEFKGGLPHGVKPTR